MHKLHVTVLLRSYRFIFTSNARVFDWSLKRERKHGTSVRRYFRYIRWNITLRYRVCRRAEDIKTESKRIYFRKKKRLKSTSFWKIEITRYKNHRELFLAVFQCRFKRISEINFSIDVSPSFCEIQWQQLDDITCKDLRILPANNQCSVIFVNNR